MSQLQIQPHSYLLKEPASLHVATNNRTIATKVAATSCSARPGRDSKAPSNGSVMNGVRSHSQHPFLASQSAQPLVQGGHPKLHRLQSDGAVVMQLQGAKQPPPFFKSNTVSELSPRSPHSPLAKRFATRHLAEIIGRHQDRERSCTPSPNASPAPTPPPGSQPSLADGIKSEPATKPAKFFLFSEHESTSCGNSSTTTSSDQTTTTVIVVKPQTMASLQEREDAVLGKDREATSTESLSHERARKDLLPAFNTSKYDGRSVSSPEFGTSGEEHQSKLSTDEDDGGNLSLAHSKFRSTTSFQYESFEMAVTFSGATPTPLEVSRRPLAGPAAVQPSAPRKSDDNLCSSPYKGMLDKSKESTKSSGKKSSASTKPKNQVDGNLVKGSPAKSKDRKKSAPFKSSPKSSPFKGRSKSKEPKPLVELTGFRSLSEFRVEDLPYPNSIPESQVPETDEQLSSSVEGVCDGTTGEGNIETEPEKTKGGKAKNDGSRSLFRLRRNSSKSIESPSLKGKDKSSSSLDSESKDTEPSSTEEDGKGKKTVSSLQSTPEKKSLDSRRKSDHKRANSITTILQTTPTRERKAPTSVSASASPAQTMKPPLPPMSPSRTKSFHRESPKKDDTGKGSSLSSGSLTSIPNLFSPDQPKDGSGHDSSAQDSGMSEGESPIHRRKKDAKKKDADKRKPASLSKRLSTSMMNLLKGENKSTTKTSWTFTEPSPLALCTNTGLTGTEFLTAEDRQQYFEESEIVPRMENLESLRPPQQPSTDISPTSTLTSGPKPPDKRDVDSDEEYQTASESENDVSSSVSIITVPSDAVAREAGYMSAALMPKPQSLKPPPLPPKEPREEPVSELPPLPEMRSSEVSSPGSISLTDIEIMEVTGMDGDKPGTPLDEEDFMDEVVKLPSDRRLSELVVSKSRMKEVKRPSSVSPRTSIKRPSSASPRTSVRKSTKSPSPSGFSRFSKGRVPVRKTTPSSSKSPSPLPSSSSSSSLSGQVEKMKQQKKLEKAKAGTGSFKKGNSSSPKVSPSARKAFSTTRLPSVKSPPTQASPVMTPSAQRKRRIGIGLHSVALSTEKEKKPERVRKSSNSTGDTPKGVRTPESSDMRLNVDRLLNKVGQKLAEEVLPAVDSEITRSTTGSQDSESEQNRTRLELNDLLGLESKSLPNKPQPLALDSNVPEIAVMPATLFSPTSSTHSHQSSIDLEQEVTERTPIPSKRVVHRRAPPPPTSATSTISREQSIEHPVTPEIISPESTPTPSKRVVHRKAPPPPSSASEAGSTDTGEETGGRLLSPDDAVSPKDTPTPSRRIVHRKAPPPPVSKTSVAGTTGSTSTEVSKKRPIQVVHTHAPITTAPVKVTVASAQGPRKQKVVTVTAGASRDKPETITQTTRTTPTATSRVPVTPVTRPVFATSKSDSKIAMGRVSSGQRPTAARPKTSFTANLPPKPPSSSHGSPRKQHSESVLTSPRRGSDRTSSQAAEREKSAKPPSGGSLGRSSHLSSREAPLRASLRKSTPSTSNSTAPTSTSAEGGTKSAKSSVAAGGPLRPSLRASGRKKKLSAPASPNHPVVATPPSPRKVSAFVRPGYSTLRSSRRSSPGARDSSLRTSPARQSMRRVSSNEMPRKIKPGASATLTLRRDRKPSSHSSLNASMRASRTSVATPVRPQSVSASSIHNTRGTALTRSLRLSRTVAPGISRTSSSGRKISAFGTLPRGSSTLSRKDTPPVSALGSVHSSPARMSMRKQSSAKDVFAVFDQISAEAQSTM